MAKQTNLQSALLIADAANRIISQRIYQQQPIDQQAIRNKSQNKHRTDTREVLE
jgi:hypothetical protein